MFHSRQGPGCVSSLHSAFVGVDSGLCLAVRYAVTGGQQEDVEAEVATEDAFLDRTSLLILADDWFGKWVEKSLEMCSR